jgi:hypothetical protein
MVWVLMGLWEVMTAAVNLRLTRLAMAMVAAKTLGVMKMAVAATMTMVIAIIVIAGWMRL